MSQTTKELREATEGDPTNEERVAWAEQTLTFYDQAKNGTGSNEAEDSPVENLTDLLTDILHYAKAMNITIEDCWGTAKMHYAAEAEVEMTDDDYYNHKADNHEGEPTEDIYDARGIYVAEVCEKCRTRALRGYRLEIFDNPHYEADEPFDEE